MIIQFFCHRRSLFIHFFLSRSALIRSDLKGLTELYQARKKFMALLWLLKILLQFMPFSTNRANEFRIARFSRSIYAVLSSHKRELFGQSFKDSWMLWICRSNEEQFKMLHLSKQTKDHPKSHAATRQRPDAEEMEPALKKGNEFHFGYKLH